MAFDLVAWTNSLRGIPAGDFATAVQAILAENDRRQAQPLVEAGQAQVVADLRTAGTVSAPAVPKMPTRAADFPAWKDPGTDHSRMYLRGDRVTRDGKVWESRVAGLNSWQPGGAGVWETVWADVTAQGLATEPSTSPSGPPAWAAGVAYKTGDKVTYLGRTYTVAQAHTSQSDWLPAGVASLYTPA